MSVAMATYNGAEYVAEQLGSILDQLGRDDEVVVVDDASSDDTVAVVRSLRDPRVDVVVNDRNLGYVRAFERALSRSRGDFIFLADQDDVWPVGRLDAMRAALASAGLVTGRVVLLDSGAGLTSPFGVRDWALPAGSVSSPWTPVAKLAASNAPYFGCAMGVRRDLLDLALPFPDSVQELHDAWLALVGLFARSCVHINDPVVLRRVHGGNASGRIRAPLRVLRGRVYFARMAMSAWRRTRAHGRIGVTNSLR